MDSEKMETAYDIAVSYFENEQYDEALNLWRQLAEKGMGQACYAIGYAYDNGKGVDNAA